MDARRWVWVWVALIAAGCEGGGESVAPVQRPIIEGMAASEAEVSATVALVGNTADNFCSGTLIAPDVVLTAAHCVLQDNGDGSFGGTVDPSSVFVAAGVTDAASAERYAVARVWAHPEFPASSSSDPQLFDEHDVGALVLAEPVAGVTPVPILAPDAIDAELRPRRMLGVAGFGATDAAGMGYNTRLYVGAMPFLRRSEWEIAAGDPHGVDTCYGDSGGPAYVDTAGGDRVVGITSRGLDPSVEQCVAGTVFTLAPAYLAMLEDATGRDLSPGATTPDPDPDPDPDPTYADSGPGPDPSSGDAAAVPPGLDPPIDARRRRALAGGCFCDATGAAPADGGPRHAAFVVLLALTWLVSLRARARLRRR